MKDAVNDSFSPGSSRPSPSTLSREDYWSEEATFTLIRAWGRRYVDLNRGSLRQKHWQEVANAVNDRHFNTGRNVSAAKSQPYRTDVQCKNRIDTLKKKYKVEKARVSESHGSAWPFFPDLDELLRETFPGTATASAAPDDNRRQSLPVMSIAPVPVAPRSAISRRPAPPAIMSIGGDNLLGFRGNLNAFAAAAAAAAASPAYGDDSDGSRSRSSGGGGGGNRKRGREKKGYKEVAEAIERFGKIYEKVEERKRKEMVELEKQRMRFAKELECHRMQLFTEMQVRLHKLRRGSSGSNGQTSSANAALEYGMMDFPSYF